MAIIPEIVPISDLRLRQSEVLDKLANGPVVLTQHSRARAVLVDMGQWRRLMEEMEDLQDALTSLQARATDKEEPIPLEDALAELGIKEKAKS